MVLDVPSEGQAHYVGQTGDEWETRLECLYAQTIHPTPSLVQVNGINNMTSYLYSLLLNMIASDIEVCIFFDPAKWNNPVCPIHQFCDFMNIEPFVINK